MSITTFNASVELNQSVEKQLGASMVCFTTRTVEFLASEYGFDAQEAIQRLGLDSVTVSRPMKKKAAAKAPKVPKVKRMVPSFPLPFCGVVNEDWCCGLRLCHGLYSQCTMAKDKDGDFCKTCTKQADKSESNKPTYGVIQDRMAVGAMEFRDSKGKQVVSYGNVMKKLKIEKDTAIAEAAKFGLVIAEEQFEERKTTRGRPKKDASASDSDSDKSEKKRGRPKKIKKVVTAAVGDDLIASLVVQAQLEGLSSDGSESDASDKSDGSTSSTSSKKAKKTKAPKPVLTDEEKAAKKAATLAKRAATIAAKPELTDEEKEAKKAATSAKRAATLAAKKAKAEAEAPAAILGVTVPDDAITVTVVDTVSDIVEAVSGPSLEPAISVTELVAESDSDSDSDVLEVHAFDWQGVSYLKADDNLLYNPESQDVIGRWNDTLMKVDALPANCDDE